MLTRQFLASYGPFNKPAVVEVNVKRAIKFLLISVVMYGQDICANPIDDLIDSVKCMGSSDSLCKDKSAQEREAALRRIRAEHGNTPRESPAESGGGEDARTGPPCLTDRLVAQTDVDTAYARVMSIYRFPTLADRKAMEDRGYVNPDDFKHNAMPGARYEMADFVPWLGPDGQHEAGWTEMTLMKDGSQRTIVAVVYCDQAKTGLATSKRWQKYFHSRLENALNGL